MIKLTNYSFQVSVVTRDEVGAYKPYLWEQSTFYNGVLFREWMLTKIVNGERASYSAPKFARMQERTRSQMLEDIVANLQNHAETGQIPKPYRSASLLLSFTSIFKDVTKLLYGDSLYLGNLFDFLIF
jgi:RAP1 GTPase activating protein 1